MINHYQNEAETYNEIIIEKELSATRKSRNAIAIAIVTTVVYKIVRKKNIMVAAILLLMASIFFLVTSACYACCSRSLSRFV